MSPGGDAGRAADAWSRDLASARRGDGTAFERLVAPLVPALLALIARRTSANRRPWADVEDLLQLVLGRAWGSLPSFAGVRPASLRAWMAAIARSIVIDSARGAVSRADARHLESLGDEIALRAIARHLTSVGSRLVREERTRQLLDALDTLPETQRRVVEAHVLEGRSFAEIAAELSLAKTTVFDHLERGLQRLAIQMRSQGDPPR